MRVLWISNIIFPELCNKIGIPAPVVGGWMQACAKALLDKNGKLTLGVVSFYNGNNIQIFRDSEIQYYLVPEHTTISKVYDKRTEDYLKQVYTDFQPDLVHIHGSEYGHSLAMVKACNNINMIVSIQGLVSVYKNYYYGGLSGRDILSHITLRDILRQDSLFDQKRRMAKRGEMELELLKSVNHVIGRTSWDQSCAWAINPMLHYHFCNETLRDGFYQHAWELKSCVRHRIFLSQGQYPIKGLHQVVKALPLILREYPDAEVYVAGNNFYSNIPLYKKNGYANYIEKLMDKTGVTEKFHFLGQLNEENMIGQYLKAHVFICPSAIENSPNSVGEAQLLGTPVVASYVGGSMDMVENGVSGFLYRFEEVPLLAERVCELFANQELCIKLSEQERMVAAKRHDRNLNAEMLIKIYNDIVSC